MHHGETYKYIASENAKGLNVHELGVNLDLPKLISVSKNQHAASEDRESSFLKFKVTCKYIASENVKGLNMYELGVNAVSDIAADEFAKHISVSRNQHRLGDLWNIWARVNGVVIGVNGVVNGVLIIIPAWTVLLYGAIARSVPERLRKKECKLKCSDTTETGYLPLQKRGAYVQ